GPCEAKMWSKPEPRLPSPPANSPIPRRHLEPPQWGNSPLKRGREIPTCNRPVAGIHCNRQPSGYTQTAQSERAEPFAALLFRGDLQPFQIG
ncbi:MAG: hypothetical protein KDE31_24640, partial [Caldilineaceae bacterium]|nr:hypothetical protein [Caldilineaceae bacterium]